MSDEKLQAIISNDEVLQVTINVQHTVDTDMEMLYSIIKKGILFDVDKRNVLINTDQRFIRGRFDNDTGLTGRKMMGRYIWRFSSSWWRYFFWQRSLKGR